MIAHLDAIHAATGLVHLFVFVQSKLVCADDMSH